MNFIPMVKIFKNINRQLAYSREDNVSEPDRQELQIGDIVEDAFVSHNINLSENNLEVYDRKYFFSSHSYYKIEANSYVVEAENGDESRFESRGLPQYLTGWQSYDGTEFIGTGNVVDSEFITQYYPNDERNLNLFGIWEETRFIRVIIFTFESQAVAIKGRYNVSISSENSYDETNIFGLSPNFKKTIDYTNRENHLALHIDGRESDCIELGSGDGCVSAFGGANTKYPTYYGVKNDDSVTITLTFSETQLIPSYITNLTTNEVTYGAFVCENGLSRDYPIKGAEMSQPLTYLGDSVWTLFLNNINSDKTVFVKLVSKPLVTATVPDIGSGFVEITGTDAQPSQIAQNSKTVVMFPGEHCFIWANPQQGFFFDGWYKDAACTLPVPNDIHGHTYLNRTYEAIAGMVSENQKFYAKFSNANFLTFTANEKGSSVGFYCDGDTDTGKNMQYSTDGGVTWQDYTIGIGSDNVVPITLEEGESVKFRGINENLANIIDEWDYRVIRCAVGGSVAASGDATSLLNGVGGDVAVPEYCYSGMFGDCTGLTTAPALPATALASGCYGYMFSGCTSLAQAPSLPATTLAGDCYGYMFSGCTSLTQAPALPATALAGGCYGYMFSGCTSLAQAPSLPATTLAAYCYNNMFNGCTSLTQAPSLSVTTLTEYCYNGMFSGCTSLVTAPELPAMELEDGCYSGMFYECTSLTTAPELPATTLASSCYRYMFSNCTSLSTVPALSATTLADHCYQYMFVNCTSLATAPELPTTELADYCYEDMFDGCISLTQAPALPATTLAGGCYWRMFNGCTSLTQAPALPATTLAGACYGYMFSGCTSLAQAPDLPATTLVFNCYYYMFNNCTVLTQAPELAATQLADGCYSGMFYGCTGIMRHEIATLNNSVTVFYDNTSCVSLTIHAVTPPIIGGNTITGLKADCIIYVPAASVDVYKSALYWSARASYIQAMV